MTNIRNDIRINDNGTIYYGSIYEPFDKELKKEIGISWFDARDRFHEIGNSPGIYPDTALLFVKLIKLMRINRILEFGSGISTLFISKICQLKNIEFISYEEDPKYMSMTVDLLKMYGIRNADNIVKSITNVDDDIENINFNVDLLFLDASLDLRFRILGMNKIYNIPFILLDDAEGHPINISKFLVNSKRYNFCYFNRVGREDRYQFINCMDSEINMMDFINKNVPCIGRW